MQHVWTVKKVKYEKESVVIKFKSTEIKSMSFSECVGRYSIPCLVHMTKCLTKQKQFKKKNT